MSKLTAPALNAEALQKMLDMAQRDIEKLQDKIAQQASIEEATGQQAMALLQNEIRLRTILDNISDGIVTLDTNGSVHSLSLAARKMFGYTEADLEDFNGSTLFARREHMRFGQLCDTYLNQVEYQIDGLREETYTFVAMTQGGKEFPVDISLSKAKFDGQTILLVVVRDAREREATAKAEEEKKNLVRLMRRVAEAANEATNLNAAVRACLKHVCDYTRWPLGHCYMYDPAMEKLFSSNLWHVDDEKTYKSFIEASEILSPPIDRSWVGEVYRSGKPVYARNILEAPTFLRHDVAKQCELSAGFAFPILIGNEVVAVMEFFSNEFDTPKDQFLEVMSNIGSQLGRVTERERAAKQLMAEKEKAEAANVSKSEFLANMSHELRTPMNGVLGMVQILAETALSDDQGHYVERIHKSAESLLTILNDILDFSKIEADMLDLEMIPFDLVNTLESIVELFHPRAKERGIDLLIDLNKTQHLWVMGDEGRIRQVVTNLVSNAVKFTEDGYVKVILDAKESNGLIDAVVKVEDTGCGIPEGQLFNIFNKFTQADTSVTRKFGGTGLGLAICKKLLKLMDGVIGVDSAPGKGSTFWFKAPFEPVEEDVVQSMMTKQQQEQTACNKHGKGVLDAKVLLVEDDPVNREVANRFLNKMGFASIDMAENGAEGLTAIGRENYDIVLMDCSMPVMDGFSATQAIRAEEDSDHHVPIVATTANAMVGDRERCLKVGMDDYVSKPINAPELKRVLGRWINFDDAGESMNDAKQAALGPQAVDGQPVDMEHLFSFTDGDPAVLKELSGLFFQTVEECMKGLEESAADESEEGHENWRKAAHRLKGAGGNLGAMKLHGICYEAEQGYTKDSGFKQVLLGQIQNEIEVVSDFLAQQSC